jgi:hypothetical protein
MQATQIALFSNITSLIKQSDYLRFIKFVFVFFLF